MTASHTNCVIPVALGQTVARMKLACVTVGRVL